MRKQVDVAIAFFGKPMQTIIAIKSLMQYSGQYIGKIYLTHEQVQPHGDWSGIYKVLDYFRDEPVRFVVQRPYYFLTTNVFNLKKTRRNALYRQSIMYQYALEKTDKSLLCIIHNDMLFHADVIGPMIDAFEGQANLAGTGAIGQCWACPAWFAGRCSSTKMEHYRPGKEEVLELHKTYAVPRQQRDIEIIEAGRVYPLPECRLNEHVCLINVDLYRSQTVPTGDIGCLGGTWGGADLGMVWFYEMVNRGFKFRHFTVDDYAKHAPFDDTGSGSAAYSQAERYWNSENKAIDYINQHYTKKTEFGSAVLINTKINGLRRGVRSVVTGTYELAKRTALRLIYRY